MAGRKLIDGDAQGEHVSFVQIVKLVVEQLPRQVSATHIQLRLLELSHFLRRCLHSLHDKRC